MIKLDYMAAAYVCCACDLRGRVPHKPRYPLQSSRQPQLPGEMATAAKAFEVIAFSGGVWSWSAAYAAKQARIASTLTPHSGRQVGGRPTSGHLRPGGSLNGGNRLRNLQLKQQLYAEQHEPRWQRRPGTAPETEHHSSRRRRTLGSGEVCEPETAEDQQSADEPPPSARPTTAVHRNSRRAATADEAVAVGFIPQLATVQATSRPPAEAAAYHCGGATAAALQPCDPERLADACAWVEAWPAAVGSTRLMAALLAAQQCGWRRGANSVGVSPRLSPRQRGGGGQPATPAQSSPDCWYLFSDGLADDAAECLRWAEEQRARGRPLPPVHAVGFLTLGDARDGAGERFLRQLAAITGGTFQVG
jgi:hypothetical protein